MELQAEIKKVIRDIPDFPEKGIVFKDITPLLKDTELCSKMLDYLAEHYTQQNIEAVAAIESRGFMFGFPLAIRLGVPFIPFRKKGKLPYDVVSYEYDLEYGSATIEAHTDAIEPNTRVLIHDDLLATGGTASASAELVKKLNGQIAGFSFLVELGFLNGRKALSKYDAEVHNFISF